MYLLNSFLIFCLLLFCPLDGFAKMYKWVDKDGKIHLSSQKPEDVREDEEDIEKGWVPILYFQGVETIAKSKSFQLQGIEGKIKWEVVKSKEKIADLDKEIEHAEKKKGISRRELENKEKELKQANTAPEKDKIRLEKDKIRLEGELIRLDKEIASLEEEKNAVSLKVMINDNTGTFKETVLDTRKNRGQLPIKEIKEGNYYLEVSADPDCHWDIKIIEKEGKALSGEDKESKAMVSAPVNKAEFPVSQSGSEIVKVEGVRINKTKFSDLWGVIGKIRNLSNSPIKGSVTIKFLGSNGDIVKTDSRTVNNGDPIKPGQAAPFESWEDRKDFNGVVDFQIIFKEEK